MKPRLLDLFCGGGGAGKGYADAGFEVVGVDIAAQPDYPFEFKQEDFESYMDRVGPVADQWFDAIHASPPCQAYSALSGLTTKDYPALVERVRERLRATGLPYVIENVVGAPLESPVRLCGSSFGLGVWRHRLFECSFPLLVPACDHSACPEPIDVTGTGGRPSKPRSKPGGGLSRKPVNLAQARQVMGIQWMTRPELAEAIPPAFTSFIGAALLAHLDAERKQAA